MIFKSEKTAAFAQEIGAHAVASPQEAITVADLVILAVKPQFVQAALLEAKRSNFRQATVNCFHCGQVRLLQNCINCLRLPNRFVLFV